MARDFISVVANRSRFRLRPTAEGLEVRTLMAVAGSPDPTFNAGGYALKQSMVGYFTGLTTLTSVAVENDGSIIAAGLAGRLNSTAFGLIHLTASGQFDKTFGRGGGEVDIPLFAGYDTPSDLKTLLIQPDGKIIVAGVVSSSSPNPNPDGSIVVRFNADGTIDPTFGTNGEVLIGPGGRALGGALLSFGALQKDGKIVLAGSTPNPSGATGSTEVVVTRLKTDGSLDTSFGTQGRVVLTDQTPQQLTATTASRETVGSVAIQPDGRIVVASSLAGSSGSGSPAPSFSPELFRINTSGSRDLSLSQAGLFSSVIAVPDPNGLVVQPDGKILLLGNQIFYPDLGSKAILIRLNADGSLDRTAVLPGQFVAFSTLSGLALQPDGDVLLSGSAGGAALGALRLTPGLTPDDTFGTAGVAKLPGPSLTGYNQFFQGNAIAVAPDGKIVLAGLDSILAKVGTTVFEDLVVARITTTGSAQPGDYTGDGIADPTIYLPTLGDFAIRSSSGGPDQILPFGIPGAGQTIPVAANFDGSNRQELAVYLPSLGAFAYRPTSGGPDQIITFGIAGKGQTIPAPGDYFGTGQTDIAAYLPILGDFALRNPLGGPDQIIPFGIAGAGQTIPAPGDYDGSGRTELAVYLPTLGAFAYRPASGGADVFVRFGIAGQGQTIPDPGDYDGSSHTELAVYLPALGDIIYRPANGVADVVIRFGFPGLGQSIPVPGDYTGAGITEPALYLPSYGTFVYRPTPTTGLDVNEPFGVPGPGETIPVTVIVDEALATGSGEIFASSIPIPAADLLDFVPDLAATKFLVHRFSN